MQDLHVGKSAVGPRTFAQCESFFGIIALQFVGRLLGGSLVGLTLGASQVCCTQSPCPCSRPLLAYASTGDTQNSKAGLDQSLVGSMGPGAHKALFEPSECL